MFKHTQNYINQNVESTDKLFLTYHACLNLFKYKSMEHSLAKLGRNRYSYITGGNANWYSLSGEVLSVYMKSTHPYILTNNLLLGIHLEDILPTIRKIPHTRLFTATL